MSLDTISYPLSTLRNGTWQDNPQSSTETGVESLLQRMETHIQYVRASDCELLLREISLLKITTSLEVRVVNLGLRILCSDKAVALPEDPVIRKALFIALEGKGISSLKGLLQLLKDQSDEDGRAKLEAGLPLLMDAPASYDRATLAGDILLVPRGEAARSFAQAAPFLKGVKEHHCYVLSVIRDILADEHGEALLQEVLPHIQNIEDGKIVEHLLLAAHHLLPKTYRNDLLELLVSAYRQLNPPLVMQEKSLSTQYIPYYLRELFVDEPDLKSDLEADLRRKLDDSKTGLWVRLYLRGCQEIFAEVQD